MAFILFHVIRDLILTLESRWGHRQQPEDTLHRQTNCRTETEDFPIREERAGWHRSWNSRYADRPEVVAFIYRFDEKQKRMVFGVYPKMGVARAHGALADARDKMREAIDPGANIRNLLLRT